MDVIEIVLLIICAPFAIGAAFYGLYAMTFGLGFCVAAILEGAGIKIEVEKKNLLWLGTLIGWPSFLIIGTLSYFSKIAMWILIIVAVIAYFVACHWRKGKMLADKALTKDSLQYQHPQIENIPHIVQNKVGVKQAWTLMEFARLHGRMKVAPFVNKETGEHFKSCAFVNANNEVILVAFSHKLGELTPKEISEQKDNLQVVLLSSGTYKLCKRELTYDTI